MAFRLNFLEQFGAGSFEVVGKFHGSVQGPG
jgi:hypothetical protein